MTRRSFIPTLVVLVSLVAPSGRPAMADDTSGAFPEVGAMFGDPLADAHARGGFLATAAGPSAVLALPAAIANAPGSRSLVQLDIIEGHFAGGLFAWQPGRIALGYRHVDSRVLGYDEDQYMLVLGRSRPGSVWGTEVAWIRNDVAGAADALTLGASMALRPSPRLSLAARVMHLNRPHYLDDRLRRTIGIGLGLHGMQRRLTLATDLFLRDDGADDLLVRYGAEVRPGNGVHLGLAVDNEGGFRLALALTDQQNQVGYGFGSESSGRHRQTVHLGYEEQRAGRGRRLPGR
jgi:hypothetical protein